MKKAIVPAAILCTVLCIGLGNQSVGEAEPTPVPSSTPSQVEVTAAPTPKVEIPELKVEEPVVRTISPTPTPVPTPIPTTVSAETPAPTHMPAPVPVPDTHQSAQTDDMVYVPGFDWLESKGEGAVIYDETMYENGNKVGSMD